MDTVDDHGLIETWPLFGLVLRAGDLVLRPTRDVDAVEQGSIVHRLLPAEQHYFMPRLMNGALAATEAETARNVIRFTWRTRAEMTPDRWSILMAVRHEGVVIGMQSIEAEHFKVTREIRTGSYLAAGSRRQGIGTAMRAIVLEFAFQHLAAQFATSGFMSGNDASQRVSQRLGYEPDGIRFGEFRGARQHEQRVRLTAERWSRFRPDWLNQLEVVGGSAVLPMLGAGAVVIGDG